MALKCSKTLFLVKIVKSEHPTSKKSPAALRYALDPTLSDIGYKCYTFSEHDSRMKWIVDATVADKYSDYF